MTYQCQLFVGPKSIKRLYRRWIWDPPAAPTSSWRFSFTNESPPKALGWDEFAELVDWSVIDLAGRAGASNFGGWFLWWKPWIVSLSRPCRCPVANRGPPLSRRFIPSASRMADVRLPMCLKSSQSECRTNWTFATSWTGACPRCPPYRRGPWGCQQESPTQNLFCRQPRLHLQTPMTSRSQWKAVLGLFLKRRSLTLIWMFWLCITIGDVECVMSGKAFMMDGAGSKEPRKNEHFAYSTLFFMPKQIEAKTVDL